MLKTLLPATELLSYIHPLAVLEGFIIFEKDFLYGARVALSPFVKLCFSTVAFGLKTV